MVKFKGLLFLLFVLVLVCTVQLTAATDEERRAKEEDWHRREKTAEEDERRRWIPEEEEDEREERRPWRPDEEGEEREERRPWRPDEEEEEREDPPYHPGGGGSGGKDIFVLRDAERVVSTEAGEMRVVRGFGGGGGGGRRGLVVERSLHIGFITMEPRSLFVPQYLDSSLIIFVRRGEAKIGLIYEDEMGERPLKMGDVYRIPAGSTFYIVNTGETQRLHIVCSIDASEGLGFGAFQSFFVGGGTNPVSILAGFDRQTLSTAFNVSIGELEQVMTSQKAGPIVFADTTNGTDVPILWANFLKLKEDERLARLKMVAPNGEFETREREDGGSWTWRNLLDPLLGPENKRKEGKGDEKRIGSTPDSVNLFDRDVRFT